MTAPIKIYSPSDNNDIRGGYYWILWTPEGEMIQQWDEHGKERSIVDYFNLPMARLQLFPAISNRSPLVIDLDQGAIVGWLKKWVRDVQQNIDTSEVIATRTIDAVELTLSGDLKLYIFIYDNGNIRITPNPEP